MCVGCALDSHLGRLADEVVLHPAGHQVHHITCSKTECIISGRFSPLTTLLHNQCFNKRPDLIQKTCSCTIMAQKKSTELVCRTRFTFRAQLFYS